MCSILRSTASSEVIVGTAVVVIGSVGGWDAETAVPFGLGTTGGFGPAGCLLCAIVPGIHRMDLVIYGCGHRRVAICFESRQVDRGISCVTKVEGGYLLTGRGIMARLRMVCLSDDNA